MLGCHDIEPDIVGDEIFIERLVVQVGRDLGIAIFVGEACAHRVHGIKHVRGNEGIGYLATVEGSHGTCPPVSDRSPSDPDMKPATWVTNSAGCSISG